MIESFPDGFVPRKHQIEAADAIFAAWKRGVRRPAVDMCVGSGKSYTMGIVSRRTWEMGQRSVTLADRRELVEQNAKAFRNLGLECGINAAALNERTWRGPSISASIHSVHRNTMQLGNLGLINIDECFPLGTRVATPSGSELIENLRKGHKVLHALGVGEVLATSEKRTTELVEIKFNDGRKLRCTPEHPVFTLQGWIVARRLETGSCVVSMQGVSDLRAGVFPNQNKRQSAEGKSLEQAEDLLSVLRKETTEPNAFSCRAGENDSYNSRNRSQAEGSRRQRKGNVAATGGFISRARKGMEYRGFGSDRLGKGTRASESLSDRHCTHRDEDSNRSGRRITRREAPHIGRTEGQSAPFARVESVSRIKLESPITVYNLHVSGHPSYFAEGHLVHNCHMIPHGQAGIYRSFLRAFPHARQALYTGTPFRLNGGRIDEGPDAPSDEIVYTYGIIDGINDGYLVPAFTAEALGKIDPNLLKKTSGEFTASSQDAQTIDLIESHIAQLKIIGTNRRSWLIFEASVKSAELMTEALNRHGISARCITEKTPDTQRTLWIEAFKTGAIRALVNVAALTTGFDAQICDMLVMRRRTASLGLYVQMIGRLLRTIGGHISLSIAAGKADGVVVDFAGNVDQHGPLDFLRPKESPIRMVDCMSCKKANVSAAVRCWNCNEKMTRVCPGCNEDIEKGLKQCPLCEAVLDNRNADGSVDEAKPRNANLLEMPSGAALIQAFRPIAAKEGGWVPIRKAFKVDDMPTILDANGDSWALTNQMEGHMSTARWVRGGENGVAAFLLKPNGMSRSNAMMVTPAGIAMPVPMPPTLSGVQEA